MNLDSFKDEYAKIETLYNSPVRLKQTDEYVKRMIGKPIVIFGASFLGDNFYEKITKIIGGGGGGGVIGFCDNYRTGVTPNGNSPIFTVSELKKNYTNSNIVISVNHQRREKVFQQLLDCGFNKEQVFVDVNFLWAQGNLADFEQHKDGYAWAYDHFDDDLSKTNVIARIKRYLFGEPLKKTTNDIQYFKKDIIRLTHNEIFIDGGCFIGDTVEEFIKQSNNYFAHIYSFEPDAENCQRAATALEGENNLTFINKGLWSSETELQFQMIQGSGSGSFNLHKSNQKQLSVQVTSLDSFFQDMPENEWPTFIKLDIEGSELEAIRGAENIIRTRHPKMALSAYHKPEDVYELPKIIAEYDRTYLMSLVQHDNDNIHETVLYAV